MGTSEEPHLPAAEQTNFKAERMWPDRRSNIEAVTECAWNTLDTYIPKPANYTPLLGDRSVYLPKY
jgi:hypothetical protein